MTVTQTDDAGNETVSPARTFAVSTAKPPPPPDKILPEVDDEVIVSATPSPEWSSRSRSTSP
jgi:hypothetical protein